MKVIYSHHISILKRPKTKLYSLEEESRKGLTNKNKKNVFYYKDKLIRIQVYILIPFGAIQYHVILFF